VVIFFVLLLTQVPPQGEREVYKQGIELMRTQGPDAMINFFSRQLEEGAGDLSALFGLAWGYWLKGDLAIAKQACEFILTKDPEVNVAANCHYLLGYIAAQNREAVAVTHLTQALEFYQKSDNVQGIFLANNGLAFAEILNQDYEKATIHLIQSQALLDQVEANKGHYYELRSRVAFRSGEYDRALDYGRLSYREYEKLDDLKSMTNAKCSNGFFLMLLGRFKEAVEVMTEVDAIVEEQNYEYLSVYAAANWLYAYKCKGQDFQKLERYIKRWLEQNNDETLKYHLDFVLEKSCPQ
jgi:tetratricopeptide (TPR) repeat protein